MDINQRKRAGRLGKSGNNEVMGPPPQVSDSNEVLDVTAIAISPTPEEAESMSNIPPAECRRSSRKKIIKFDVRDLLNKNRKPHKIQIEARIDSNAPTNSKTSTATSGEITSAKPSSISGDLLIKQKTFLEKSAIFRRYSISQEPKPPPPPLPLPPSLLGKGGDIKDATGTGVTTSRRLSRTQEFFSNAMIKPKQTTSLIVAQMESSAPSISGKRKNLNKFVETETKNSNSTDSTTVQKRRGRPSKTKNKSSENTSLSNSSKEISKIKKLTPEKATNWKEYKACLAQQTGTNENIDTQGKIEVSSQNTLESVTADVLINISSSSSHVSNIEVHVDNESLADGQHHGKIIDDAPIDLNLIPEVCTEKNSKLSIINPTSRKDDLIEAVKFENQIKVLETTAPEQVSEKFVQVKLRDFDDYSEVADEKKDAYAIDCQEQPHNDKQSTKELINEEETTSSQSTMKECLDKSTECQGKIISTISDDSAHELRALVADSKKGQNIPEMSVHIEKSSETNKDEIIALSIISEQEVMEPQANIIPIITNDSSKQNNSAQQQDLLLKETKSKTYQSTNRRSRSKHNSSPQDNKGKFDISLVNKTKPKHSESTEELDGSLQKVSSPEETAINIVQSKKDSEITISPNSQQTKNEVTEASAFEELIENKVLPQISEQTKTKEESIEIAITKITETTHTSTERKSNKKAIIDHKEDDSEASMGDSANENKKLFEKLDMENSLDEATENVQDQKDKTTIRKPPRNKINLNKQDESLQHAECKIDASISKNLNEYQIKLTNTIEQINIGEVTNSETNISLSSEEFQNFKRTELNTPDPSYNTAQDEQENAPKIKLAAIENEEILLFHPSTPTDKKSLTLSRTSSSSESENQSERSSYSSTTTSSTSTSTRSYKSGDKLKISLKRISLPQSPSSSSQISTSEEQSSPSLALSEDIKKLPKAKRSKRLQKKFVKMLDIQNSADNIDNCFQKITTHNKDELQISNTDIGIKETELQSPNVAEYFQENIAIESTVKVNETVEENQLAPLETRNVKEKETNEDKADDTPTANELGEKQIKCFPTEESIKTATELQTAKDLIDPIKPSTSKVKHINDNSTKTKRKSLRNRKEIDSTDKDQETTESQNEAERNFKKKELQESNLLRNRQDENDQQTKETVSEIAEIVEEKDIKQQQDPHIQNQTAQKSERLEIEEQDKLMEATKTETIKLKDEQQISLTKPEQQQQGMSTDEQTGHQEYEKGEHQKELELHTVENQQDNIQLKEQEVLLTEPSILKVISFDDPAIVEKEEAAMEITVDIDINNFVSSDSSEDKVKFKATENILNKELQGKESIVGKNNEIDNIYEDKAKFKAKENIINKELQGKESITEKTNEIDNIYELEKKESAIITTKSDKLITAVKENEYSDQCSIRDDSDKTVSSKSTKFYTDSKEIPTSKITSTGSKTAESSKADIQIVQKEFSKISSLEEIHKDEETFMDIKETENLSSKNDEELTSIKDNDTTLLKETENLSSQNDEELNSMKDNDTTLLPHKEANKFAIDVIDKEFCNYLTKKSDLPSTTDEDKTKSIFEATGLQSPTPIVSTKTKPDIERPTSIKRKSLRNQKEYTINVSSLETNKQVKTHEENSSVKSSAALHEQSQVLIEDPDFTVKTQEIKENKVDIMTNVNAKEPIKVSKRRGRKSRFKNLHSPEVESETESSTGKQTPIEEIILAENNDEENMEIVVANEDKNDVELVKTNEKELTVVIKEYPEDTETLTTVALEENEDAIQLTVEQKSPTHPDLIQESAPVVEHSMKPLISQTAPCESYLIQNVSIETNTLLDILRTVQSNTAAALEANNKKTENPTQEISTIDENNTLKNMQISIVKPEDLPSTSQEGNNKKTENPTQEISTIDENNYLKNMQKPVVKPEDLPSTSQDGNLVTLKSLRKVETDSNTNSPTRCDTASPLTLKTIRKLETDSNTNSPNRCDTASPLTLKKVAISPTRSDSNSPLTFKKVGLSPTRSDTSSPLTLKKVTRRYERRSRRGDESDHKTLEETFAEIAAQSSKAVLAAKTFDIPAELPVDEVKEKDLISEILAEHEVATAAAAIEETKLSTENQEKIEIENINKTVLEVLETTIKNDPAEIEVKVVDIPENSEVAENSKNISEPDKSEDIEKLSDGMIIETCESNITEAELETTVSDKVTPARRGRKPKNRSIEVVLPIPNDSEIKNSPISKKDTKKPTKDLEETSSELELPTESPLKYIEQHLQKQESGLETTLKQDVIKISNDEQLSFKETNEVHQTPETTLKSLDDSKISKKSHKKSDSSKGLTPTPAETDNLANEDEIRTPKQVVKKRDSSLTKSETKSLTKKSTKKTKTNEEELIATQKEDNLPKTTTPPPKRGRKPKNQQEPLQTTTISKKKNKKDPPTEKDDAEVLEEKGKDLETENESANSSFDKSLDEKIAKKKRQKKLKEAFEAALTDDLNKIADMTSTSSNPNPTTSSTIAFGLTLLNKSPPPQPSDSLVSEIMREECLTPVDEDPDPLKDIEKFIADGVNLLKKDYKLDEDSVGDVITTTIKTNENVEMPIKSDIEDDKPIHNTFETPADTPVTTPSATPPPKSPISIESTTPDEYSGVRRSHRIKLITQTPKALVGRGLVRDKERFSIKDDVETKSHYTLDDHLLDLAEVEAKNAKFLKEMEERLSNFQVIKENEYLCERVISREARKMICDCFLTHEEEERGELGCGEDCLNRLLMIECGPECNVKERCTNKRFQKLLCSPCRVFRTEKKGFGIMADIEILPGEFIMEYVGEVIDTDIFEQRRIMYSQDKNRHYYFMALRSDAIIDATIQGNISRFINHSCDPNAETQKWTVNGELRIGFFSRKSIMPGEEITFNYQYQRYGREAQRCYCESSNCRGWIGQEPTSDEGEQIDDDDYEESEDDEEEEEEQDTSNLLVHDDEEDSDGSVTDPEEVQKKLEMAAAQAEAELAPINISEDKETNKDSLLTENKENDDSVKPDTEEEDSKSKFKKLLSKMAEKVAAKQKQNKRQQKLQRKKKSKESSADLTNKLRFSEDPDIEDEVEFLRECGLKNQSDTLRLSRLMVRAKLVQTRLNLLDILQKGDLPCRRLFLDYHGLRLVHGWMSEDAGNMQIRLALLQTLETLPIANKTVLTDSKVMQMVRNWCGSNISLSPNEDSSSSNSNSQDNSLQTNTNMEEGSDLQELHKLALKLITTWEGLPEIFRIPKKERIEQMKEHEREADRQYAANAETEENKTSADRYRRNRFGTTSTFTTTTPSNRFTKPNNGNPLRTLNTKHESTTNLSKAQRREMFAAKVARDEAEKRMAEERREFETKCRFFGLDPKKTRPQDVPFCVNPATGQWYSVERKPIITPPSYTHVQVPVKPKSTDPNDYQLPAVCSSLTAQWKYAITPQGKIYYYHNKYRIPQWEPPTPAQLQLSEMEADDYDSESDLTTTAGEDSSEDDDEILIGMDAVQLRAYIDRKVETRRQKRYERLVDQRAISPRREEDRVYNQIEVRKYKENKEKIRKRKEEIRRKRAEALRQSSLNMCTLGSVTDASALKLQTESDEELGVLPIQDYLLSSDEDGDLKTDGNNALLDKIVEGDKIVDELDALTSKRQLKRPLPPHRDLNEPSTSSVVVLTAIEKQEYKKRKLEKKDKKKPKDQDAKYRKNKEKFRCEIAGIIVHYLKPYRRETCPKGHIQTNDDFNHLARKLTHFVMIKELKYCESVGQTLVVTESVKNKSREFIKKYMAKYGDVYVKPSNDPDFKDIPFTL